MKLNLDDITFIIVSYKSEDIIERCLLKYFGLSLNAKGIIALLKYKTLFLLFVTTLTIFLVSGFENFKVGSTISKL